MAREEMEVKRDVLVPCMTCPLCHKLFRDATTIIECLHTFCRKCIYKKLLDEETDCCPVCNINLGCAPVEKLRPDHSLQDVRLKIFPRRRITVRTPEVVTPVVPHAKRKERSLSALVISTPRVSTQVGLTGRRSKSVARKALSGSNLSTGKHAVSSTEELPGGSGSPEILKRSTQNSKQKSSAGEPSNHHITDKGRESGSGLEHSEGTSDLWKPLTCLVEAASRSKSSKLGAQGSAAKSEELQPYEPEGPRSKTKNEPNPKKSKLKSENSCLDNAPLESERPKKPHKVRQKSRDSRECMVPPQVVLDAGSAKLDSRKHPIWFSLVASNEIDGDAQPLAQISASYLRIKDGSIPVSFIQKYLKKKLDLVTEEEVTLKCMGQAIIPTLTLNHLVDLWLQATSTERMPATIGQSAKDFVMVLSYARRTPSSSKTEQQ